VDELGNLQVGPHQAAMARQLPIPHRAGKRARALRSDGWAAASQKRGGRALAGPRRGGKKKARGLRGNSVGPGRGGREGALAGPRAMMGHKERGMGLGGFLFLYISFSSNSLLKCMLHKFTQQSTKKIDASCGMMQPPNIISRVY
jgi:hypothetical protein